MSTHRLGDQRVQRRGRLAVGRLPRELRHLACLELLDHLPRRRPRADPRCQRLNHLLLKADGFISISRRRSTIEVGSDPVGDSPVAPLARHRSEGGHVVVLLQAPRAPPWPRRRGSRRPESRRATSRTVPAPPPTAARSPREVHIPALQMETSDRGVQLVALPAVTAREREIQSPPRRRHDQHRPNRERANPRRSATAANGRVTSAIALGSLGASTTGSTDIDGPPSSGQGFAEGSRPASGKSLIRLRRIPLVTPGGHAATSKGGRLRSSCGSVPIGYVGALAGISVLVSARSGLMRAST